MKLKYFYLHNIIIVFLVFFFFCINLSLAQTQDAAEPQIAGKIFGVEVPASNYYFAKRAVISFGAKWRGTPKDEKELEELVWQELLFSFESFRQEIQASPEEIDEEIEKLLQASKVEFKWRIDKEAYQNWVKDTLHTDIDAFRNQLEHLVKLEKLRKQTLDSFDPKVSQEEAYQKFLDEYNTLMVELKQFDEQKQAEEFHEKSIIPASTKETEELIWNDMLISYEAAKREIKADDEETNKEIIKLLRSYEAKFNWKEEADKYEAWVKETFNVSSEVFKNNIAQLVAIETLRLKIISKEEPEIKEKQQFQQFLEKNKMISIAYSLFFDTYLESKEDVLRFVDLQDAKAFYAKIKRTAGYWEDEKRKDPKSFKVPGFVALDFLINLWGFKSEDAYKMLEKDLGSFYPPSPIYKGYGVFKILKIRRAAPEEFDKRRDNYFSKVKTKKQYELYKQWVEELKQKAEIEKYIPR
ncbi:MAG: hypothetical protein KAS13_06255 [Candidatus Omnitrophica bacterium]|nr:hypothetical protein [Candidatus Omnitrophota bacterium]